MCHICRAVYGVCELWSRLLSHQEARGGALTSSHIPAEWHSPQPIKQLLSPPRVEIWSLSKGTNRARKALSRHLRRSKEKKLLRLTGNTEGLLTKVRRLEGLYSRQRHCAGPSRQIPFSPAISQPFTMDLRAGLWSITSYMPYLRAREWTRPKWLLFRHSSWKAWVKGMTLALISAVQVILQL